MPGNELAVADGIGASGIVAYLRALVGCYVDIEGDLSATSANHTVTRSIDSSTEGVVAKLAHIECQQVLCLDANVVGEVFEILMVEGTGDDADVLAIVVDGVVGKDDFVGDELDGIVAKGVGGVEGNDAQCAIGNSCAREVDGAEQAVESQITIDADVHISHKAAAERLKELASCMVGVDEEFYVVALWRHIAIDVDVREWPFLGALAFEWECRLHGLQAKQVVVGNSMDVDLLQFVVQSCIGSENTHTSVLEPEVVDA